MANVGQKTNYINDVREQASCLLDAVEALTALREEWDDLMSGILADEDFVDSNDGITVAELTAVVGTTYEAFQALIDGGHGTNLYKLKR